jgi:hypothetical protein
MVDRPDFPTMEQVEKATHEQLARWYRFLPSGDTKEQQKIQDHIGGTIQGTRRHESGTVEKDRFLAGPLLPFDTGCAPQKIRTPRIYN